MASEITINPTAGNAPFPTQGGVGASPGFDAIDYRRFWSHQYREGVVNKDGWKVTEDPGGASLQIRIAANDGPAFVAGDSVNDQGLYYVAPHSAAVDLDVPTPDATNPRIDRVVIQVRDDAHDASGENDARVRIIAGTPTSGATLDNLSGAAAIPGTALLLANVLVQAGDATVSNSQIRDNRRYGLRDATVGTIRATAASTAAPGWKICDGSEVRRDVFGELYFIIGDAYGDGDGSSTINLPDLVGRAPIGAGSASGLTTRNRGEKVGSQSHNHLKNDTAYSVFFAGTPGDTWTVLHGLSGGAADTTFTDTTPPSTVVNFEIFTGMVV